MRDLSTTDLDWNDQSAASFDTASLVDRHSTFDGNFRSQRDLRVEGELKGNVTCEGTLFVSEGATISATVEAEHVTVAGELTGEIRCRGRLQILPSGRVRANVSTGSLVIQEGAIYEGELRMSNVGEGPAGEDSGSSVQVTAGTTAGSDQAAGARLAATPYRMATATTAGRRGGPPPRGDEGQRPEPGPDGEPDGDPEDNR